MYLKNMNKKFQNLKKKYLKLAKYFLARSAMCYRRYQNDREYFAGDKSTTIHVCSHGSANVQGMGVILNFLEKNMTCALSC